MDKIIYAVLQLSLDRWMDLYKVLDIAMDFADDQHRERIEFLKNAIKELIERNIRDK